MPTPAPDINLSALANIRIKVRRLTRSLSPLQLTDIEIDNYINNFVLYDFPQHLRLFDMHKTLSFYTQPNVDVYETNTTDPNNPLYNFNNAIVSINPPVYCAGFLLSYSQSREQFFSIYPRINSIQSIGTTGDGITTNFIGVINTQSNIVPPNVSQQVGLLQRNVLFDSVDANGNGLSLVDVPVTNWTGNLIVPNDTATIRGTINYVTGAFNITFPTAPAAGATINSQTVPYVPSRPQSILFYDNKFTLRPVPDQPYKIDMEVYQRPSYLLAGDTPEISQWWQVIAYGAAKKVFQDRMDLDSVALIEPEYREQMRLVLRKTIMQNTNERVATIYTEQLNFGPNGNGFGWGGGWNF